MISIITIHKGNIQDLLETTSSIDQNYLHLSTEQQHENIIIFNGNPEEIELIRPSKYRSYIINQDKSLYDAMNLGVKHAKGSLCIFLNSGDVLYSHHSIYEALKYIDSKNQCYQFEVVLEFGRDLYYPKKNEDYFAHNGFFAPIGKQKIYFDTQKKISSDGEWSISYQSSYGLKRIDKPIVKMRLGGISNNPTVQSVRQRISFSMLDGCKEAIKFVLKLILGQQYFYRTIYQFKYKRFVSE